MSWRLDVRFGARFVTTRIRIARKKNLMATTKQFEDSRGWHGNNAQVNGLYAAFSMGLRKQICRAAVSVLSNVAEGFKRGIRKEFIQFLSIAKGFFGEAHAPFPGALDPEYLAAARFVGRKAQAVTLSCRVASFIAFLEKHRHNPRVQKPFKHDA